MVFCAGNVYLRDVGFLVDILLLLGFYVTPVFYDVATVPRRWRWLVDWNPMSPLLRSQRDVLMNHTAPNWSQFGIVSALAIATFLAGITVFNRSSGRFVDEI